MSIGPQTDFARHIHREKYQFNNESFEESKYRIASALCPDPVHYRKFSEILLDQRFLPGGRIAANLGHSRATTALNCFVLESPRDSFVDGPESIMETCTKAAMTLRAGGGIGTDWSGLRPRGDLISTLDARASGPVSFLPIIDGVCKATASAGHRRGAQMVTMRVDHPDIEEFVHAKRDQHSLTSMNISVLITDTFMYAVNNDRMFPLTWNGKTYKTVHAPTLWDAIMRNAWDYAEPGVLFIDTANKMNPLYYAEELITTNPCSEIFLPAWGCCLLGSFNLVKYLVPKGNRVGFVFNIAKFERDVSVVLEAMDNVVEATNYPLPVYKTEMHNKRRIGIGVTGLANAIEAMYPLKPAYYGSHYFLSNVRNIMSTLRDSLYYESTELAERKGAFPLFDAKQHIKSRFIQRLPLWIRQRIEKYGLRNSHLLAIAPTGTISLTADNVSSGLEPVFAHTTERSYIDFKEGVKTATLEDYGVRMFGVKGMTSSNVTPMQHLDVLSIVQRYVDQSCSKTINFDGNVNDWREFKYIYQHGYQLECKGVSVFNASGKRNGILKTTSDDSDAAESCRIDPDTGARSCED